MNQPKGIGEELIPLINSLQDKFAQARIAKSINLRLPQVAVVGSQSSGKSSVLEALVGKDILPRGKEICTRRPLILQLVQKDAKPGHPVEWGEFLHLKGEKFTDFEKIRDEIAAETDRTAEGQSISKDPIRLMICSPYVLTMTLVDLPGTTKVPVGNQPPDIEAQIRDLVNSYIKHETCLILAVSPANTDLATSDALMLARSVDPHGYRTIGVITKLDIMDAGTNAVEALKGNVIKLKLGYIGVVNRNQAAIQAKYDMKYAQQTEAEFFANHPEYTEVLPQCGIRNLSFTLSTLLASHIQSHLPLLRRQVETRLREARQKVEMLGARAPQGGREQGALVLRLLKGVAARLSDLVEGKAKAYQVSGATDLYGGARIRYIFRDVFTRSLENLDPIDELTNQDIWACIENSGGTRGSLLLPEAPFELLARTAIARLLEPCLQCLSLVLKELTNLIDQAAKEPELESFPCLTEEVRRHSEEFAIAALIPAEASVKSLVDCNLAYINKSHPQFIGIAEAIHVAELSIRQKREEAAADPLPDPATSANPQVDPVTPATHPLGDRTPTKTEPEHDTDQQPLNASRNTSAFLSFLRRTKDSPANIPAGRGASSKQDAAGSGGGGMSGGAGAGMSSLVHRGEDGSLSLKPPPQGLPVKDIESEQEELQINIMRVLLSSYYDCVRRTMQDMVPKVAMHYMVNELTSHIEPHLIQLLYREESFPALLAEPGDLGKRRQQAHDTLTALQEACEAIDSVAAKMTRKHVSKPSDSPSSTKKENSPIMANGYPNGFKLDE